MTADMTIESLQKRLAKFRDDRNWKQFHNPKDLAISIALEAAELLEVFQWSGSDVSAEGKREKIEEELADVMMYCLLFADATDLQIDEIILKKLKRNEQKYPVAQAYGRADKYTAYTKEVKTTEKTSN